MDLHWPTIVQERLSQLSVSAKHLLRKTLLIMSPTPIWDKPTTTKEIGNKLKNGTKNVSKLILAS